MAEHENEEFLEIETPAQADNFAIEETILSAMGDDPNDIKWLICVFRIPKDGGKDVALFRLNDPREVTTIMDKLLPFGTGEYRVVAYRNGKIFRKMIYPIEVLPEPVRAQHNGTTDFASLVTAINQNNQAMMDRIEMIFARRTAETPQIDPMATMERTLQMAASLAGLRDERQPPVPVSNGPSMTDMMSIFKMGMEVAENAGPSTKKGPMDLISDFINSPIIGKILQPQETPAPVNGVPHTPQIPQPRALSLHDLQMQFMATIINQLLEFASRNIEVAQGADWFLNNAPPVMVDQMLQDNTLLTKLEQPFPALVQYHGWFAGFLEAVRMAVREPDELRTTDPSHGNPNGSSGDAGNAKGDASHSPPRDPGS